EFRRVLCGSKAGIVATVQEYAWSSDRQYRRGKGSEWLDVDRLLPMLGHGRSAAIRGYRRLMREELEEPYEKAETWGQAVRGEEAFADRFLRDAGEPRILRRSLTIEKVAREVARQQGISVAQMITLGQGRVGSLGRVLTAWVGREVGGISIARTAKYFRRDTSTMARNVSRLEERMRSAKGLRSLCNGLVEKLDVWQSTNVQD